jgi:hypothetical protein
VWTGSSWLRMEADGRVFLNKKMKYENENENGKFLD